MSGRNITFPELVLVTGAAGAVGSALCQALMEQGVAVVATDCLGRPSSLAESIDVARWIVADLECSDDRAQLVESIRQMSSGSLGIVHNASLVGTSELDGWIAPLKSQSTETWSRALEVNLTASFSITRDLSPLLEKSPGSAVVNVSSIYSSLAPDWSLYERTDMGNPAAYGVAKAGLEQLTRWLASYLAPSTRVNAVSPGGLSRNQPDMFVERYQAKVPLGRMGREQEIVEPILFLLSSQSSYITGQVLIVDGGYSIT